MSVKSIHAFAEKVVLITDGTNTFGRAVAMQLALNGAFVIVGVPNPRADEAELIEDLSNLGTLVKVCNWDPTDENGATKFVELASAFFGRIDHLVNCLQFGDTENNCDTLDDTLRATYSVTRSALKIMELRPKPRVVTIVATNAGSNAFASVANSIIEHGIIGMTKTLASVLPVKFRVNAVRANGETAEIDVISDELGVKGSTVARTVLFLLSGESVGINGQVIEVT